MEMGAQTRKDGMDSDGDEETELIEDSTSKRKFKQENIARIRRRSWRIKALIC
jgi:hypothetical protein